MTHKEYREILKYEMLRCFREAGGDSPNLINRIRIKYFQPNSNCVYLCRKMWYLYQKGGIHRYLAKFIYLKIWRKYGCCIFPIAVVGKGFFIAHPIGIVIGDCCIGDDFKIFQNCTIGNKDVEKKSSYKRTSIGNNVTVCSGSSVLSSSVCNDVLIGAHTLVVNDITLQGKYVGIPAKRIQ